MYVSYNNGSCTCAYVRVVRLILTCNCREDTGIWLFRVGVSCIIFNVFPHFIFMCAPLFSRCVLLFMCTFMWSPLNIVCTLYVFSHMYYHTCVRMYMHVNIERLHNYVYTAYMCTVLKLKLTHSLQRILTTLTIYVCTGRTLQCTCRSNITTVEVKRKFNVECSCKPSRNKHVQGFINYS